LVIVLVAGQERYRKIRKSASDNPSDGDVADDSDRELTSRAELAYWEPKLAPEGGPDDAPFSVAMEMPLDAVVSHATF
jgi:hypothetical protein